MPTIDAELARSALVESYRALSDDVARLSEDDLACPSLCRGWTRDDLLYHVLLDAQRALVTFNTPADGEPDVDFVAYWSPFRPGGEGYDEHARFVRSVAAAHPSGLAIARRWAETATAAAHAAAAVPGDLKVATQGHVLTAGDFLATLVTEAAIHHLDLLAHQASAPGRDAPPGHEGRSADGGDHPGDRAALHGPGSGGLAVVRQTLDGILGEPVPAGWGDVEYALKGTGRAPLTQPDRARLGALAERFPLLG